MFLRRLWPAVPMMDTVPQNDMAQNDMAENDMAEKDMAEKTATVIRTAKRTSSFAAANGQRSGKTPPTRNPIRRRKIHDPSQSS